MSINKESALAKLDELEKRMPKDGASVSEENKWCDRVMFFVRHMNMNGDIFQVPPHISNLFAKTCRADYIYPDLPSWRDDALGAFFPKVSGEAMKDLQRHRVKGWKDFFERYREFLQGQYEYMESIDKRDEVDIGGCFSFEGSVTNFSTGELWKKGERSSTLVKMNKGKKRFLWQFYSEQCFGKRQKRQLAEKFIEEGLGRPDALTSKDYENLLDTLAPRCGISKKELKNLLEFGESLLLKKKVKT